MPQLDVIINGRDYRLACEDGQEAHLRALAATIDGHVKDLKGSFGEIGDNRLLVMAALLVADQVQELQTKVASLELDVESLKASASNANDEMGEAEEVVVELLTSASERLERFTASLGSGPA